MHGERGVRTCMGSVGIAFYVVQGKAPGQGFGSEAPAKLMTFIIFEANLEHRFMIFCDVEVVTIQQTLNLGQLHEYFKIQLPVRLSS